jgi:hypothetical protein
MQAYLHESTDGRSHGRAEGYVAGRLDQTALADPTETLRVRISPGYFPGYFHGIDRAVKPLVQSAGHGFTPSNDDSLEFLQLTARFIQYNLVWDGERA